jgi:hypothetical protein
MNKKDSDHFLEIHVDFDMLIDTSKYEFFVNCICGLKHKYIIYKYECSLIQGRIFTCNNCGNQAVVFGNHFMISTEKENNS